MNQIEFSDEYWDCECETNFIKPNGLHECGSCGACFIEQPPSRINEISFTERRIKEFNKAYQIGVNVLWFDDDIGHATITTTDAFILWDSPVIYLKDVGMCFLDRVHAVIN